MGFFGAVHGWKGGLTKPPLLKICHTYPIMMKPGAGIPYQKRSKKYINHVIHPLSSAEISYFSLEITSYHNLNFIMI